MQLDPLASTIKLEPEYFGSLAKVTDRYPNLRRALKHGSPSSLQNPSIHVIPSKRVDERQVTSIASHTLVHNRLPPGDDPIAALMREAGLDPGHSTRKQVYQLSPADIICNICSKHMTPSSYRMHIRYHTEQVLLGRARPHPVVTQFLNSRRCLPRDRNPLCHACGLVWLSGTGMYCHARREHPRVDINTCFPLWTWDQLRRFGLVPEPPTCPPQERTETVAPKQDNSISPELLLEIPPEIEQSPEAEHHEESPRVETVDDGKVTPDLELPAASVGLMPEPPTCQSQDTVEPAATETVITKRDHSISPKLLLEVPSAPEMEPSLKADHPKESPRVETVDDGTVTPDQLPATSDTAEFDVVHNYSPENIFERIEMEHHFLPVISEKDSLIAAERVVSSLRRIPTARKSVKRPKNSKSKKNKEKMWLYLMNRKRARKIL